LGKTVTAGFFEPVMVDDRNAMVSFDDNALALKVVYHVGDCV
jgi:hypothetical protein